MILMGDMMYDRMCDTMCDLTCDITRKKPLEMEDVPHDVWYAVYGKWVRALLFGWSDHLWCSCDLCRYLQSKDVGCLRCPLFKDSWCRGNGINSRLSLYYHSCDNDWMEDIKKFVDMVKPYRKA